MSYRVRNIVLAAVLACLAAVLTSFYVSNYKRSVQAGEEGVTVYIAAEDIPAGTMGAAAVQRGLLVEQEVDKRNVIPGAISSPEQVSSLVAVQPVYQGEQVSTRRFATEAERGIRAQINGNTRAYQLAGDHNQLLAGTLKAGDRVDVVGSWAVPEGGQRHVSRIVLRDLLVLKAPATPEIDSKIASMNNTIWTQLAVTDAQAAKLFWIAANGAWTLQLRPPVNAEDSPETVETDGSLVLDGLRDAQRRALLETTPTQETP